MAKKKRDYVYDFFDILEGKDIDVDESYLSEVEKYKNKLERKGYLFPDDKFIKYFSDLFDKEVNYKTRIFMARRREFDFARDAVYKVSIHTYSNLYSSFLKGHTICTYIFDKYRTITDYRLDVNTYFVGYMNDFNEVEDCIRKADEYIKEYLY